MSVKVWPRTATLAHPSRHSLPTLVTHGVIQQYVAPVDWLYVLAETMNIVAWVLEIESGSRLPE